jgi:ketosteroid isomerase-like protein
METAVLDRIKSSYELFNRTGQFEKEFFDADVEWHNAPEVPGAGVHRGRDAVLAELAAQGEAWESRHAIPAEMVSAGDKVVVVVHGLAIGRTSGAEVREDVVHVWTLKQGKVMRIEAFFDDDAARRSAGIDQSPSSDR